MKTLSSTLTQTQKLESSTGRKWFASVAVYLRDILSLAVAVVVAGALVTLSVWLAGRAFGPLLAACTWGLGFVFLGSAVDSRGWSTVFRGVTGVALSALALFQDRVSADFVIVSGVLLAAWAGHSVLKRTSAQDL
jgi:hypothetical protein